MADVATIRRVMNLKEEIESGGFVPWHMDTLPGYHIKRLVPREQCSHMIQITSIEPGCGKYRHAHKQADTVYVILEGEGEYFVENDRTEHVKAGDIAIAIAGQYHGIRNTGSGWLRFLCVEGPLPPQGLELIGESYTEIDRDEQGNVKV